MVTSDGSNVDSDNLKKGIEYLMKAIDLQGRGERLLSDLAKDWWMLLLGLVFAMLISFGWVMLLRLASKPVIWISIALCLGEDAFYIYGSDRISRSHNLLSSDRPSGQVCLKL